VNANVIVKALKAAKPKHVNAVKNLAVVKASFIKALIFKG